MAYTKSILCLAASRKHEGKCFAGKCVQTGEWIRPVSSRPHEEISAAESRLPDGTQAALLDVLEVPMLKATPRGHQRENHLIDPARPWRRIRRGTWEEVFQSLDDHAGPIWFNEDASSGYDNNRVSEATVARLDRSLLLIRPAGLLVSIGRKGGSFDLAIEQVMLEGADRIVDMSGSVLCLSLGEAFHGHFYKLVAAVLPPGDE